MYLLTGSDFLHYFFEVWIPPGPLALYQTFYSVFFLKTISNWAVFYCIIIVALYYVLLQIKKNKTAAVEVGKCPMIHTSLFGHLSVPGTLHFCMLSQRECTYVLKNITCKYRRVRFETQN